MITYQCYVYFEDEKDFLSHTIYRSYTNDYLFNGGTFYEPPISYPATFFYRSSPISGCCGVWIETSKSKMIEYMREDVKGINKLIEEIERN